MELKVWVDGVARVVCGLSEETSCQEVVIALAQAIGKTGRYVLILKLRDTERQLLANERPLESLAKLGQHSADVQFILRRTGPSASDGQHTERTLARDSFPLPRPAEPEPPKRKEPKKSLTFNLGPTGPSSPRTRLKQYKHSLKDSQEQVAPVASKEDVFRQVLLQQERLQSLESQLESLESEIQSWEQPPPGCKLEDELLLMEQTVRRNGAELAHEEFWETELQLEQEREQDMQRQIADLHRMLEDCGIKLQDFTTKSRALEQEISQERMGRTRKGKSASPEETISLVKAEIHSQYKQNVELETSLSETERALVKTEAILQAKNEELDELNKELRQCNLQQFIQQTGTPGAPPPRGEHHALPPHAQPDGLASAGSSLSSLESPPRPTAKQFLGNPRNLQNPLVASLNPEVLSSRETSWR
uniref:Ras association domain family member 7a n=1 Tax=Lepisosteus oculatus TaxID=7918 RepID=W5LWT5_LEPOC|nr:PREDICTED: ras association domain-containing protein 7 [Lepisosteus oculatus]XP_015193752.1 PREDICTED: ras association domain-containing protein 7 [Lepisosteus oculatus]XP_015193753.1 PREDICTED: ras association domain-containing protein 7 [Lepisosteus oculatus]XP_015193754.1 PREDICTED: ras association domain-containing protein 7 [Lepisosteus oculatus]XP_015193756.1 PREDICTED: ras association domain-containing protein 7 [Lepisosteus oculatus]XP_015193757.1 PREDICTED: ras association domain-c